MKSEISNEQVDQALEEVFAAPPFAEGTLSDLSAWKRVWFMLKTWYQNLVGDLYYSDPLIFWPVMIVLLLVLAFLIWHLSRTLGGIYRSLKDGTLDTEQESPQKIFDITPAQAALDKGELREAVELLWGIITAGFTLRYPQCVATTPRQHLHSLTPHLQREQVESLRQVLELHEEVCYAGSAPQKRLTEQAFVNAASLLDSLKP